MKEVLIFGGGGCSHSVFLQKYRINRAVTFPREISIFKSRARVAAMSMKNEAAGIGGILPRINTDETRIDLAGPGCLETELTEGTEWGRQAEMIFAKANENGGIQVNPTKSNRLNFFSHGLDDREQNTDGTQMGMAGRAGVRRSGVKTNQGELN